MKFLCFDYGLKRVGVATGQTITCTAQAETTIQWQVASPPWQAVDTLLSKWKPDAVVVGIPRNMDGTSHDLTIAATEFANEIHTRFNVTVHHMDERLSSSEAEALYKSQRLSGRRKQDKSIIDALAAQIILESWMRENGYN